MAICRRHHRSLAASAGSGCARITARAASRSTRSLAIDLARPGREPGQRSGRGNDFFAGPRLSPDGRALLWLAWQHPNMPWNGTTLFVATLDAVGNVRRPAAVAGGARGIDLPARMVARRAGIFFVSDRSNWWNLYCYDLGTRDHAAARTNEQRNSACRSGALARQHMPGRDRTVSSRVTSQDGLGHLAVLDLGRKTLRPSSFPSPSSARCVCRASARCSAPPRPITRPASSCLICASGSHRVLKKATGILDQPDLRIGDYLTIRAVHRVSDDGWQDRVWSVLSAAQS